VPAIKAETSQINNLMMHLKHLEKEEQIKPQASRWKEIIKIRPRSVSLGLKKEQRKEIKNQ
jgi:hypothetical protein